MNIQALQIVCGVETAKEIKQLRHDLKKITADRNMWCQQLKDFVQKEYYTIHPFAIESSRPSCFICSDASIDNGKCIALYDNNQLLCFGCKICISKWASPGMCIKGTDEKIHRVTRIKYIEITT